MVKITTKITQPLSCFIQNVIYIWVVHCGYQYVGKCGVGSNDWMAPTADGRGTEST